MLMPANSSPTVLSRRRWNWRETFLRMAPTTCTHCWVFTPRSFAALFEELATVGLLSFACETFHDTEFNTFEFFVTLCTCNDNERVRESWQRMKETAREYLPNSLEAKRQELIGDLLVSHQKNNTLVKQNSDLITQLNQTRLSLEAAQRRIDSLENSASWKVTAPSCVLSIEQFVNWHKTQSLGNEAARDLSDSTATGGAAM